MATNTAASNAPSGGVATGLQQPQTTVVAAGGPFIRHSQPGRRPMYLAVGVAFGGQVTNPHVAAPGYGRGHRLKFSAVGGAGSGVTGSADAPYNCVALAQLKDAFGNPLIVAPGFQAFYLLPKFGGGFGRGATRDISNFQNFQPVQAASGNFVFSTQLPYEFVKGYGVISFANASLLPTLTLNMAASTAVYSVSPGTVPTINVQNDLDFYWLPQGVNVAPPGLGTTRQWLYQQCNPAIASNSSTTVQLPRLGGYLDTLIFETRDSTGARVDAWPTRIRIIVDGVPLIDSDINDIFNDMQIQYENTSRPTGVIAISRKTSLSQVDEGLFDTGETYLSTNPGTLIEIQGAPWGTIANSPMTLNCLVGQVIPQGTLIQGLPQA